MHNHDLLIEVIARFSQTKQKRKEEKKTHKKQDRRGAEWGNSGGTWQDAATIITEQRGWLKKGQNPALHVGSNSPKAEWEKQRGVKATLCLRVWNSLPPTIETGHRGLEDVKRDKGEKGK